MKRNRKQSSAAKPGKVWQKTQYSNLLRYVPSATYFARIRVGGKLIRRSLESTVLSVAKLKLADLEKEERTRLENHQQFGSGKATFDDLLTEYRTRLEANHSIKPRTRAYYNERIEAMLKTWPDLRQFDVRKLKPEDCERWAAKYVKKSSPTNFNNTIGVLRTILQIGVERGIRYSNPAAGLKRARLRKREFKLPSQNQFHALVQEICRVPYGPGLASADLVEFLAYGGFRKNEAAHVTWADCDFDKGEIVVRGNPETGTKNSEIRRVPMIPDMLLLLERLRQKRRQSKPEDAVMRVRECQGAINRACCNLNIPRFTHHDLRHLFATRCIEGGVDIPTVSRWLGHKDGGALAMKVYGHLRDSHSVNMAQKVTFVEKN